jgi:ArsR family metal-binding transcriptional regulator
MSDFDYLLHVTPSKCRRIPINAESKLTEIIQNILYLFPNNQKEKKGKMISKEGFQIITIKTFL